MIASILILLLIQGLFWVMMGVGFRRAVEADRNRCKGVVPDEERALPPISVIVAAHNEEAVIGRLLDRLGAQQYSTYEILVVDDNSTDSTRRIVEAAASRWPGVPVRVIQAPGKGKKAAIAFGVEQAAYQLMAFTDADCQPESGWLRAVGLRHGCADGHRIVVGYAPLTARRTLFGRFQRFDAALNQIFGAAAIGWGWAYMATGRNFSYDRALFRAQGGFSRHQHVLSGDDDLFMQDAGSMAKLIWMHDPESTVPSPARTGFRDWIAQKRRHSSTGRYFRPDVKVVLSAHHLSSLALWTAPVWAGWWGAGALSIRLVLQVSVLSVIMKHLGERDLIPRLPVLAILNALYTLVIPVTGLIKAPKSWQRRVAHPPS